MSENKIDNMPSNLFIRSGAEITISAAATDEKGKTACRKMNIACYKGGALMLAGMGGTPTILDISGMAVGKKSYPILKDHNPSQVVGHSTKINKEEQSFTMEASISGTGDAAKEVVNNADNGFPWQSSFGVIAQKIIYCEAGDTIKANGLTFSGPCYVIRKSKLQEQSILALGADDETSATMVAGSAADMGTCKIEREIPMPEDKKIEAAPSVVPAPAPVIPEQETEKKIEAYRKEADNAIEALRIEKISNLPGDSEELKKIKATAISEKWTADKAELEVLRASRQRGFPAIQPVTDETITSDVIVASACKTLGASEEYLLKKHGEKVLNAADKNKIRGLRDLVQAAAALDGKILPRFSGEGHDWFRAAFSTISVPYTIGAVANKFLLDGYNFTEQAWRKCAKIGALQNLQTHTRLKIVGDTIMKVLSADGKIVNAEAAEAVYTITGDTYARMFSLSRKDMINDNISALADIPKMIGMGASKAISVKFWTLVLANTGTFFATTATTSGSQKKANQITGSSYVLSFAGLKQAYSVFNTRCSWGKCSLTDTRWESCPKF